MQKLYNTESFIKKARGVHGDRYDYSKVEYKGNKTKVCIICPAHGEFWQTPDNHLRNRHCPKCMNKNITTSTFIERARLIHGDKYDYSKAEYTNSLTKVCIICPEHGEFWQSPNVHLKGCGCPKCRKPKSTKRLTTEEFVKKAREIHGDKYDYSNVEYTNNSTRVCIICPEHGEFLQTPGNHLSGQKCPHCQGKARLTTKDFIERAKRVHGDKYDYSEIEYKGGHKPVKIICSEHGEFWQEAISHLNGCDCPQCAIKINSEKRTRNQEDLIQQFREVHGDRYDYAHIKYINANTKIKIICKEHGEFWQMPYAHFQGHGCPYCKSSHLENEIRMFLRTNDIEFIEQASKDTLPWLNRQTLDFYLPKYNVAIECQGKQHFLEDCTFGSHNGDDLQAIQRRDKEKQKKCNDNDVHLLYYSNLGIEYPYKVFEDKGTLLDEIRKK